MRQRCAKHAVLTETSPSCSRPIRTHPGAITDERRCVVIMGSAKLERLLARPDEKLVRALPCGQGSRLDSTRVGAPRPPRTVPLFILAPSDSEDRAGPGGFHLPKEASAQTRWLSPTPRLSTPVSRQLVFRHRDSARANLPPMVTRASSSAGKPGAKSTECGCRDAYREGTLTRPCLSPRSLEEGIPSKTPVPKHEPTRLARHRRSRPETGATEVTGQRHVEPTCATYLLTIFKNGHPFAEPLPAHHGGRSTPHDWPSFTSVASIDSVSRRRGRISGLSRATAPFQRFVEGAHL